MILIGESCRKWRVSNTKTRHLNHGEREILIGLNLTLMLVFKKNILKIWRRTLLIDNMKLNDYFNLKPVLRGWNLQTGLKIQILSFSGEYLSNVFSKRNLGETWF